MKGSGKIALIGLWLCWGTAAAQEPTPVLNLSMHDFVRRANAFLVGQLHMPALYKEPQHVTPNEVMFTRTYRWIGKDGRVQFIVVQNKQLQKIRDVTMTWGTANELQMMQGLLAFGTIVAAVSPRLNKKQRGDLASALLKFDPSEPYKDYRRVVGGVRYLCSLAMIPMCSAQSAKVPE